MEYSEANCEINQKCVCCCHILRQGILRAASLYFCAAKRSLACSIFSTQIFLKLSLQNEVELLCGHLTEQNKAWRTINVNCLVQNSQKRNEVTIP